jgi:predicted RecA/RadA family phage recombinase
MATADRVHTGDIYNATAGGTVVANEIGVVGGRVGIAQHAAVSGDTVAYAISGVYTFPTASASTFASGAVCYWNTSSAVITATASGNTFAGFCEGQSTNQQDFVSVRLADPDVA